MSQQEVDLMTSKWICSACDGDCVFEFSVSRKKAGVPISSMGEIERVDGSTEYIAGMLIVCEACGRQYPAAPAFIIQ